MTNRLEVDRPMTVQSINGPRVTIIQGRQLLLTTNGQGALRCAYLTNEDFISCPFSYYSCTIPMLGTPDSGNITNEPPFVSRTAPENFRLAPNSPCINAGNKLYVTASTDLDNNPRIVGGTVDIGAYEFQNPKSVISYAWLQQYGLPTDGSADFIDSAADGMNNWQEWRCGTDPTNALSVLRLLGASRAGTNLTLSWQSVAGVGYIVERSSDVSPPEGSPGLPPSQGSQIQLISRTPTR